MCMSTSLVLIVNFKHWVHSEQVVVFVTKQLSPCFQLYFLFFLLPLNCLNIDKGILVKVFAHYLAVCYFIFVISSASKTICSNLTVSFDLYSICDPFKMEIKI